MGMARIRQNMEKYDLWRSADAKRIRPVVGDLKDPLLGLTQAAFDELAHTIDVIYHCGSKLSYIAPYEYLHDANVGGTQETLRLAVTAKAKPYHYVSSLGILLAYQDLIGGQEDDPLNAEMCPDVGYFQTKYAAERVVRIARERGIPVSIHRIGLIVGDSRSGRSNADDLVGRILLGSILAGYSPDINNAMDMTPVDYIAKAMVYLSSQTASVGKVFHLLNPRPVHWNDIFDRASEVGYPTQKLDFANWVDALEKYADPTTNPLAPMIAFFHLRFARRMLGISDSHFKALGTANTRNGMIDSGITCPPVDQDLISTFLVEFVKTGLLHETPQVIA